MEEDDADEVAEIMPSHFEESMKPAAESVLETACNPCTCCEGTEVDDRDDCMEQRGPCLLRRRLHRWKKPRHLVQVRVLFMIMV